VFDNLFGPVAIEFAADGRVFVAEQPGTIEVYDNLNDSSPDLFADLGTNVHAFWDRGLLGLALDPGFTTGRPYVYVLYTYDAPIGGSPPTWGDGCPNPPGATGDGCVVSARLSRLTASGNSMVGPEQVLINDWCQQYPSHSIGSLAFGPDGALYVSGGDGASFNFADWGQDGNPLNPCGDPPGGVGAQLTPPTAEGGALRSQDLRTLSDPTSLNGAVLRINPDTGQGMPDNPLAGSSDPNARRIIAHGLRNPFRVTMRPGTNEVWIGDVGWDTWEEINRIANPLGSVENFGWPCYEGNGHQPTYDGANLNICENLYAEGAGAVVPPYFTYDHTTKVVPGESCPPNPDGSLASSSITGLAFYPGGPFPDSYDGALFFADYARNCIWVMFPGGNGLPNPSNIATFQAPAASPVDLQIGPDGALYYADLSGGTIRRIAYAGNQPPLANATASPTNGPAPLTVNFNGSGSSDPEGGPLTYAWDLDGDGAFDDSTAVQPTYTYSQPGNVVAKLRVTDAQNLSAISAPITISVGNTPPTASIDTPVVGTKWKVNDPIAFSGSASDPEQGTLPASAFTWQVVLHHCPADCHIHPLQTFSGVKSGSFAAPDHEYPSYLELRLTVTDAGGLTDTKVLQLDPKTVDVTFLSEPSGLQLSIGGFNNTTPFTKTVIEGSNNSIVAPSPQTLGGTGYAWASWSDGGAQSHNVVANTAATYTATYGALPPPPSSLVAAYSFDEGLGASAADASGNGNTGAIGASTWVPTGKFSNALSFDGTSAFVSVQDSPSLDLTTAMTLEAWVYPTAGGNDWRDVVYKANDTYYLESSSGTGAPVVGANFNGPLDGTSALPLNAWSHLAGTYDGSTMRLYVNGIQVASRPDFGQISPSAGALSIGGDALYGQLFAGRIDEVRIYKTARTASEIQADMNTPIGNPAPDAQPPTAPSGLSATAVSASQINLAWTASTDNVGVTGYRVERCQGAGCSNFVQVATPSGTSFNNTGLSAATSYSYRVRASDAAANLSPYSGVQSATTQTTTSTLVAAYAFSEGAGATVLDASGLGNGGTISNSTWTSAGKFGNALLFNGVSSLVTIADSPSLRLATGMTLEAWVNPVAVDRNWRDVIYKGNDNYYLEAMSTRKPPAPVGGGTFGETWGTAALAANTWTHIATTYDKAVLRIYVNGVQVGSRTRTGNIATSANPLQIGGDSLFGQYFRGTIDEVRVYNAALTAAQVQADMNAPIPPGP
jgi:glucose/arabinose dehydrogenase/chitodextrinase